MRRDMPVNSHNLYLFHYLADRMQEQNSKIDQLDHDLFAFNRNGLRAAIAAIEDETTELYDEWRMHKRNLHNGVVEIRHELLDIAAVAMLAYERTIAGYALARENPAAPETNLLMQPSASTTEKEA
jgi:hypothetical protein